MRPHMVRTFRARLFLVTLLTVLASTLLGVVISSLPPFWVVIDRPIINMENLRITLRQICIIPFYVVIAIVMSAVFSRRMARPLERLERAAQQLGEGDYNVHISEPCDTLEMEQLRQSTNKLAVELDKKMYLRRDFISSVSHEFKTPLTLISAYASLLSADSVSDSDRRDYAAVIAEEAGRLSDMAANILRLSKLEAQSIPENPVEYALDEQLRHSIMHFEPVWNKKGIRFDLELQEVSICADEELLRQVWLNLIDNAIKFSDPGGLVEVSVAREGDRASVTVRDHGMGMSPDTCSRAFEQFYQGESSRASEGSGLGLSLVKRIIDICGGQVRVQSALGEGSAFTVLLPINRGRA